MGQNELAHAIEVRDISKSVSHGAPLVRELWRTHTSRESRVEVRLYQG